MTSCFLLPPGRRHQQSGGHVGRALVAAENLSSEEKLLLHLFSYYDTDARGVTEANETVTVTIQFLLLRIQGLVSSANLLSVFY